MRDWLWWHCQEEREAVIGAAMTCLLLGLLLLGTAFIVSLLHAEKRPWPCEAPPAKPAKVKIWRAVV